MTNRRDRHGRGLRGPLALPNPLTGTVVPVRRRPRAVDHFTECIRQSVDRINQACPRALVGIDVGYEDVPASLSGWHPERVPLAAAVPARPPLPGQIVLFRRPIEHRAASRRDVRVLVHRAIVEQLSAITGIAPDELDPQGLAGDDDWG